MFVCCDDTARTPKRASHPNIKVFAVVSVAMSSERTDQHRSRSKLLTGGKWTSYVYMYMSEPLIRKWEVARMWSIMPSDFSLLIWHTSVWL